MRTGRAQTGFLLAVGNRCRNNMESMFWFSLHATEFSLWSCQNPNLEQQRVARAPLLSGSHQSDLQILSYQTNANDLLYEALVKSSACVNHARKALRHSGKNRLECSLGTAQTSTNKTTIVLPASADLARTGLTPTALHRSSSLWRKVCHCAPHVTS